MENISSIIATVHGKDKVIDARDQLWFTDEEHYAQLYEGGISLYLCDYSKGKGESSVTVKATLDPVRFSQIKEICMKNACRLSIPISVGNTGISFYLTAIQRVILSMKKGFSEGLNWVMGSKETKEGAAILSSKDASKIGDAFLQELGRKVEGATLTQDLSFDFSYSQEHVNSYKSLEGGYCPVSIVEINRNGYRDSSVSRNPWFIRITNFEAIRITSENGSVKYDPRSVRGKSFAYINISDEDMLFLSDKVENFVRCWINANSTQNVRDAAKKKAAAYKVRRKE